MVLIYELLQKKKAMIGIELNSTQVMGSCHHGAYSSSIRRFKVGNKEFAGDYGTLRITTKNINRFSLITTNFDLHQKLTV